MLRGIAEIVVEIFTGLLVVAILWAFKILPYDSNVVVLVVLIVVVDVGLSVKLHRIDAKLSALDEKLGDKQGASSSQASHGSAH
jgi:hypothetical protein